MPYTPTWLPGLLDFLESFLKPAPPPAPEDPLKVLTPRVLTLVFDPIIDPATGQRLSQSSYGQNWNSVDNLLAGYIADVDECSGGRVKYHEVKREYVEGFPLRESGQRYDVAGFLKILDHQAPVDEHDLVNYPALIQELNLVQRVANDEFDEAWMFGFPLAGFAEAAMVGHGAFDINGPAFQESGRRFPIMGFNYQRGVGEMLEDLGHRAERALARVWQSEAFLYWAYTPAHPTDPHVQPRNPPQVTPEKLAGLNIYEQFILFDQIAPGHANIGLLHYAPNSQNDYEWNLPAMVASNCDDWLNFPSFQNRVKQVNCQEWGGGDIRLHHKWWLNHLPKVAGETNGIWNNWWPYFIRCDHPIFGP